MLVGRIAGKRVGRAAGALVVFALSSWMHAQGDSGLPAPLTKDLTFFTSFSPLLRSIWCRAPRPSLFTHFHPDLWRMDLLPLPSLRRCARVAVSVPHWPPLSEEGGVRQSMELCMGRRSRMCRWEMLDPPRPGRPSATARELGLAEVPAPYNCISAATTLHSLAYHLD